MGRFLYSQHRHQRQPDRNLSDLVLKVAGSDPTPATNHINNSERLSWSAFSVPAKFMRQLDSDLQVPHLKFSAGWKDLYEMLYELIYLDQTHSV